MKIDFNVVVPAAQAGDKAAQNKLMEAFYAWSVTQAKSVIHDSETAKDVAVAFWTWLFTEGGLEKFDPTKGSFYSWMGVCIKRRAKDTHERRKPNLVYGHGGDGSRGDDSVSDFTEQLSAIEDLQSVAEKLRSAVQKDVFWRLIEGASAADIAQELDLSPKRVQNVIGEVRGIIRATIGD